MKETAPKTHYARAKDGTQVAYQVIGDGPLDILFLSGWFGHVAGRWEDPAFSRFLRRSRRFRD